MEPVKPLPLLFNKYTTSNVGLSGITEEGLRLYKQHPEQLQLEINKYTEKIKSMDAERDGTRDAVGYRSRDSKTSAQRAAAESSLAFYQDKMESAKQLMPRVAERSASTVRGGLYHPEPQVRILCPVRSQEPAFNARSTQPALTRTTTAPAAIVVTERTTTHDELEERYGGNRAAEAERTQAAARTGADASKSFVTDSSLQKLK